MDINNLMAVTGNHFLRDDLHITCQYDEGDAIVFQQLHFYLLLLCLVFLGDGQTEIRNAELLRYWSHIFMVADNERYLHIPLACAITR